VGKPEIAFMKRLSLLNAVETSPGYTPPPCFLQKSPQAIENKGEGLQKERQESSRVRKRLKGQDLGVIGGRDQRGFVEMTH